MIFLGVLFSKEREKEIIANSLSGVSNAANSFQWKMIRGIQENTEESMVIINMLPVGTWPRYYRRYNLPDRTWIHEGTICHEVGSLNLPFIKQLTRMRKIRKLLKQYNKENEILIFTAYLPFLWAVYHLDTSRKVTAVITDIPEFYDMHQVSGFRKLLRRLHNKIVYHYMSRVDRFVLLTEMMKEPLHVGNRPYMVMEGICDNLSRVTLKENDTSFSLLYTGRLNKRYGLETLLNAVERIDDPNLELWLCGSGEMEQEIQKRSRRDGRIKFFGFMSHEETLALQQRASVLVNPRTNDSEYTKYSFPSKTMEYMAAGKPVMMYRLDGIPAEYDSHLFYIPEETEESICQTILKLRDMPEEEREQISEKAKEFVMSKKNRSAQMCRVLKFMKTSR